MGDTLTAQVMFGRSKRSVRDLLVIVGETVSYAKVKGCSVTFRNSAIVMLQSFIEAVKTFLFREPDTKKEETVLPEVAVILVGVSLLSKPLFRDTLKVVLAINSTVKAR